jgi:hypothetical protein
MTRLWGYWLPGFVIATLYCSVSQAATPTASRVSPSGSSVTVTVGQNQSFTVRGTDADCDLANVEWFIGSSSEAWHNLSGCSDTDSWSYQFNTTGTFTISAYVYDSNTNNGFVWWEVDVVTNQAPNAYRVSPSGSSSTICPGTTVDFTVRGTDVNCDLSNVEWFVGSTSEAWHPVSGCEDTDGWNRRFDYEGTYIVSAYIYDKGARNDFVWWEIIVENPAPSVYRDSPLSSGVETVVGETLCLRARAEDECCDLANAEWFVGSTSVLWQTASGCSDIIEWCYEPTSTGVHVVYCYVYDEAGQSDFTWWEITVTEGDPPVASRILPLSQNQTECPGMTIDFTVRGSDVDCDLANVEWFVGSNSEAWHSISGCDDTDNWSRRFDNEGTFTVSAYVYDSFGHNDFVFWVVTITSVPESEQISPQTSLTAYVGDTRYFTVRALSSCCDLSNAYFYINDQLVFTNPISGCEELVSVGHKFESAGQYVVKAVIQNSKNHTSIKQWDVHVRERPFSSPHDNAVWLGYGWISDPHSQAEVNDLLGYLVYHDIRAVYINMGTLNSSGTIEDPQWVNIDALLTQIANYRQNFNAYVEAHAWINANLTSGGPDLSDESVRQTIVSDLMRLLGDGGSPGVDGIHMDVEDFSLIDIHLTDYRFLLRELSIAMEDYDGEVLSIAALPYSPFGVVHDRFTLANYRNMDAIVDRILVMGYNSGEDTYEGYRDWVYNQLDHILPEIKSQLYWGSPAYKKASGSHDPSVENLENTVDIIIGYQGDSSILRGLSPYGQWEMLHGEWVYFAENWLGKPGTPVVITAFSGRADGEHVELSWRLSNPSQIKQMRVYRSSGGPAQLSMINDGSFDVNGGVFIDSHVSLSTKYWYQLGVEDNLGEEYLSPVIEVTTATLELMLSQNRPNPFNPSTTISFTTANATRIMVSVYDIEGKLVRTLIDGTFPAGWKEIIWDGTDAFGNPVGSGVYFCRLEAGKKVLTRKMVLLK